MSHKFLDRIVINMFTFSSEGLWFTGLSEECLLQDYAEVLLRVQAHAHARIFAWLLGTCISETTADIAGNQTSMPEDQRELYTMQTTSAKVSRRQRHRGG